MRRPVFALGGPLANECFDSSDFPNSLLGSTPACETLLFGMPTGPTRQMKPCTWKAMSFTPCS